AVLFFGMDPGLWSAMFAGVCGIFLLSSLMHLRGERTREVPRFLEDAWVLTPDDAPDLFRNVEALAAHVGTRPPDRVIIGLAPTVYVVDGDLQWEGERLSGRSLYVGFEPLRRLEREELDALLLHELAHHGRGRAAHAEGLGS